MVISLKRCGDRRAFIRRQLDGLGVAFQFFDAVDARELSPAEIQTSAPGGGVDYCGMLTAPEIACALSHLRAIRSIKDSGARYVAIFEDDVKASPALCRFLDEGVLDSLPPFDILQLDGRHVGGLRLTLPLGEFYGRELCAMTKGPHSVFALIYSRAAAEKIAATLDVVRSPIDNMIFKDMRVPGLRIVGIRPAIVTHYGLPSVIGDRTNTLGIAAKTAREMRRLFSWFRRWRNFVRAWGTTGVIALVLRRADVSSAGSVSFPRLDEKTH